jgi:hypothetical protein
LIAASIGFGVRIISREISAERTDKYAGKDIETEYNHREIHSGKVFFIEFFSVAGKCQGDCEDDRKHTEEVHHS